MKVIRKTKFKMQRTVVIRPMNNNIFNSFQLQDFLESSFFSVISAKQSPSTSWACSCSIAYTYEGPPQSRNTLTMTSRSYMVHARNGILTHEVPRWTTVNLNWCVSARRALILPPHHGSLNGRGRSPTACWGSHRTRHLRDTLGR